MTNPGTTNPGATTDLVDHFVLHVNGVDREIHDSWLGENLLDVLRDRLGLVGAKGACEQGECGSCSVLVDGALVCSCLVMVDAGAVQCGFYTPGLIVAVHDLVDREPAPTEAVIREQLAGNVCRCTGYGRIIEAVQRVSVARAPSRAPSRSEPTS